MLGERGITPMSHPVAHALPDQPALAEVHDLRQFREGKIQSCLAEA